MKTINTLDPKPFRRLCMTIGELPSSYLDSMTYYEMVAWLCEYIKKNVVTAINDHALAIKEIQDWIETLDLQDEVDDKIDRMKESGELAEIITQYLEVHGILSFDSVPDMKAAENLIDGSFVETYGFYAAGDGGGAKYKITENVDPNAHQEILDNGLYASLIVEKVVNLNAFGCYGNGSDDDTENFQSAVDFASSNGYKITGNGNYVISDTIEFGNVIGINVNINNISTNNLGNKPLFKFDHTRQSDIKINRIIGQKISVPTITSFYDHNSAFLLHGTSYMNIDVKLVQNFVCCFTLYSTGGSGSEGIYYNTLKAEKADVFILTHMVTNDGCINGNVIKDSLHYLTDWTNPTDAVSYTVLNDAHGTSSPIYQNNHNEFKGIMVELIGTGYSYKLADISDLNSCQIIVDRIETSPAFDAENSITYNSNSGYNLIQFNSGWFTLPNDKLVLGNNNFVVSYNNYKFGLISNYKVYDSNAYATLNSTDFEYVVNSVSDGHIGYNIYTKEGWIRGVFKAKTNLSAYTNIKFCDFGQKPESGHYGFGIVYTTDSGSANTVTPVGTIKQVVNSYEVRMRLGTAITAGTYIIIDYKTN